MSIRSARFSNLNVDAKGFNGQQQTGITRRGPTSRLDGKNGYWIRNPKWLTLPSVTSSEQKVVGLYAVTPHFEMAIMTCNNAYTVDWGDGTVTNHVSGATAQYKYNYNSLSNSTLVEDPEYDGVYKQVIITITPQSGQNLTTVNFHVIPGGYTAFSLRPPVNWLDIVISGPNITTLQIGSSSTLTTSSSVYFPLLEQVSVLSNNITTNGKFVFYALLNLRNVPILNTTTWQSFQNTFDGCRRLQYVCPLDGRRVTTATAMFQNCSSLNEAPIIYFSSSNTATTSAVTVMNNMFIACSNLEYVPYYDTANVSTFQAMFQNCTALKRVPTFDTTCLNGGSGVSLNGMLSNCPALEELPNFNTKFVTDMSSFASSCTRLTTIPKYDYSNVTTLSSCFSFCYNIKSYPDFDTTYKCTTFDNLHNSNYALVKAPRYEVSNGSSFNNTWGSCRCLVTPPTFLFNNQDIGVVPKISTYSNMFNGCFALQSGPRINPSNNRTRTAGSTPFAGISGMFTDCFSIRKIGPYSFDSSGTFTNFADTCTSLTDIDITFPDYGVAATLGTHGSSYFFPTGTVRGQVSNVVFKNINTSFSIACTSIGFAAVNNMFRNLGKAPAGTITITNSFIANTTWGQAVTLNFDRVNGSNILIGPSTTGVLVGQSVTGGNLGYLRLQTCFVDGPNNTVTLENHGMPANSNIYPPVLISKGIERWGLNPGQWSNTRIHPSGNTIPRQWMTLRRANGIFMTVAAKSNVSAWSTDGYTWNNSYLPAEQVWVEVAYGANTWVAIANRKGVSDTSSETTNAAAYSTDNGVTWNHCNLPANSNWSSVAYGNGIFVAVQGGIQGFTYADTATSTNGINWTRRASAYFGGSLIAANTIKFVYDRFFVLAGYGSTHAILRYSFDGINWFQASLPSGYWKDITHNNGIYYAVSGGGFAQTVGAISTDGVSWSTTTLPFSARHSRFEWGGGEWVILPGASSPDTTVSNNSHFAARTNWNAVASLPNNGFGVDQYWQGLAYEENTSRFVALAGGNFAGSSAGQHIAYLTTATSNVVAHMNVCPQVESLSKEYNGVVFYARDITANTFKLSVTKGGPVWNIGNASSNGCSSNTRQFIRIGSVVTSVTNGTQVIISTPSFSTAASVSTVFKANADYVIAAMRSWTITG